MAITINRIIIHELKKEVKQSAAQLVVSETVIPNIQDDRILNLVEQLNKRYRDSNEKFGVFNSATPTVFHQEFGLYANNLTELQFIQFTQNAAHDLRSRIENVPPAKGGYLLFADFNTTSRFIGVFLVRNTSGVSFNLVGNQFNINDVQHIDVENLAMACRVNHLRHQEDENRYLSFIHNKQDHVSNFFKQWIASTDLESNKEDTLNLHELIKLLPVPANNETGEIPELIAFLDIVYQTIKSFPNQKVNLRTLSEILYGDEDYLSEAAESNDLRINSEFKADNTVLRKFVQVKVKADGIDLTFPLSAYRELIEIDENNSDVIIIRSERLANKISQFINLPTE